VIFEVVKQKAKELKKQTLTVYFASRDPNLPMYIRIIAILVAAYALSPIDLIPDFIPILGLLDDIIIVPLGLALIIHLTPPEIIEAAKIKALQSAERPTSYVAAFIFIFIWLAILLLSGQWLYHEFIT
jgi:uncharacterized membrane protein YkvA (DUF1232 family)